MQRISFVYLEFKYTKLCIYMYLSHLTSSNCINIIIVVTLSIVYIFIFKDLEINENTVLLKKRFVHTQQSI